MSGWRPVAAVVLAVGVGGGAALAVGCLSDASGPGAHGQARFALAPRFATVGPELVAFDQIRVTVVRAPCAGADSGQPGPAGRTAVDTLVAFPAEVDSVNLRIVVPLEAPREEFLVFVRLITAAGDTAYRTDPYPQCVVALAGGASAVLAPLLRYVGIGADAVSVVITTVESLVSFGGVLDLAATALDAVGQPIPGTPIAWSSLDPARVLVTDVGLGLVLGGVERGPARIVARLPTGLADTVLITAQPLPSLLNIAGGNNQQGVAGLPLPLPLGVRVLGADGLGVQQVPVTFRPLIPGASVRDAVVMSDANGYAETVGTLPLLPVLTNVFEAAVTGVTPVVFGGLALAPIAQVLVTPTGTILDALLATVPFSAVARDSGGNVITTSFIWSSSDPNVAAVDPATGLARAVGNGVATITATAQGVTGTARLDVLQRVAQLVFGTQPGNTIAGEPINPVEVRALDPLGSVAQNFSAPITLFRSDGGACPATLLGGTADAVQGVATFPNLIIQQACSGLQLSATADAVTSPPSTSFSVLPGPAAVISQLSGGGQIGNVATTIAQPLVVQVTDQFGNGVGGYPVSWVTGSGFLSPTSSVTDAAGFTSSAWTLGTVAGTQAAEARAGSLTGSPVAFPAQAIAGAAARLVYLVQPSAVPILTPISPPIQVGAEDQYGNRATTWGTPINVDWGNNPVAALLGGTATRTPVSGVAIFDNLTINVVGTLFTLVARSGGLPPVESAPFNVTLF